MIIIPTFAPANQDPEAKVLQIAFGNLSPV